MPTLSSVPEVSQPDNLIESLVNMLDSHGIESSVSLLDDLEALINQQIKNVLDAIDNDKLMYYENLIEKQGGRYL